MGCPAYSCWDNHIPFRMSYEVQMATKQEVNQQKIEELEKRARKQEVDNIA